MNLGNAIREIRKSKSIGQEELAVNSGIKQSRLSQIENGEKPGEETLKNICAYLQVPVALVYAMSFEKGDVPAEKADLYEKLFPVIQRLVMDMVSN
jgi:transcriptional regulator with XRE-family HTH domain